MKLADEICILSSRRPAKKNSSSQQMKSASSDLTAIKDLQKQNSLSQQRKSTSSGLTAVRDLLKQSSLSQQMKSASSDITATLIFKQENQKMEGSETQKKKKIWKSRKKRISTSKLSRKLSVDQFQQIFFQMEKV